MLKLEKNLYLFENRRQICLFRSPGNCDCLQVCIQFSIFCYPNQPFDHNCIKRFSKEGPAISSSFFTANLINLWTLRKPPCAIWSFFLVWSLFRNLICSKSFSLKALQPSLSKIFSAPSRSVRSGFLNNDAIYGFSTEIEARFDNRRSFHFVFVTGVYG